MADNLLGQTFEVGLRPLDNLARLEGVQSIVELGMPTCKHVSEPSFEAVHVLGIGTRNRLYYMFNTTGVIVRNLVSENEIMECKMHAV